MDLDLSTSLHHLLEVMDIFQTRAAEVVNGSRWLKGSCVSGRSLVRSISSFVLNVIIRRSFSTDISDAMCGFKFVSIETLREVVRVGASSDKWFFGAELIICAKKAGKTVVELPVTWTDDRNSKVRLAPLTVEYLSAIADLKKRLG